MTRIILSVTNDLATDQRVLRTCDCFNELGYEILLIGRQLKDSLEINRSYKTVRFRLLFNRGFLFYAEYNLRLFFLLLFLKKKELLYANDLDTLFPNFLMSRLSSCKLIYDSHEYFTEVPELVSRPKVKSFWIKMEQYIFPKLKNVLTVNQHLADIYSAKYAVPVTAVRNVPMAFFKKKAISLSFLKNDQKVIMYQGALNLGRGLELIIDTMPDLKNYLLILAGEGDVSTQLKIRVKEKKLDHQVIFLGTLTPEELRYVTPHADVGISLEEDLGLSYRYCLPNKVFDYIHAGVPLLVSALPEMQDLLRNYRVGETLAKRNSKTLSSVIEKIVSNKSDYVTELERAAADLNWEKEKKILIKFIEKIE